MQCLQVCGAINLLPRIKGVPGFTKTLLELMAIGTVLQMVFQVFSRISLWLIVGLKHNLLSKELAVQGIHLPYV